ncbi:protein kinase [Tritrichomonas foetus]|uniref:Protein kinase n=1 Tax=Tritrichomonas foetus TaxID=1144522 RepID=A0A1J4K5J6_9EUKA|nr:protein kinase [Tritrichomonas foetus]|eukprot:OHT06671.1 protein kinase [Tritrichomonas foetus]
MTEIKDPNGRFVRMNQVQASYHDYVCYLAVEQSTGIQVYWYEFINDKLSDEEIEAAFQKLTNASKISCPTLLNILALWKTSIPPRFVVITEAAQSPSLTEYMRSIDTRPTTRNLLKWFKNLTTAVKSLHKQNIRHGSISLSYVFIKPGTGSVKLRLPLTGLSGRVISASSIDIDAYNSPERLRGVKTLSNDIWSLGIALLELLTGETPYDEMRTPHELFVAVLNNKMPKSLSTIDNISPLAKDLIEKCLQLETFRIDIDELLAHRVFEELDQPQQQQSNVVDSQKMNTNPLVEVTEDNTGEDIEELI